MEGHQVRALYDFTGEPGTSELSITAGEVLSVMRDNVGDGWCEGFNQNGKSGLFPAAYVQIIETPTSVPNAMISSQQSSGDYWDDDWDDDSEVGQTQAYIPQQQQLHNYKVLLLKPIYDVHFHFHQYIFFHFQEHLPLSFLIKSYLLQTLLM